MGTVSKQGTLLVKWVRSGIGFPRKQKGMVRSLGLRRLNQVVECPDNAQTRGLVASIPHLVAMVDGNSRPAWASAAEYTIGVPAPASNPPSEKAQDQPQTASSDPAATSAGAEAGAPNGEVKPSEGREASEESGASARKRPRRKKGEEKQEG